MDDGMDGGGGKDWQMVGLKELKVVGLDSTAARPAVNQQQLRSASPDEKRYVAMGGVTGVVKMNCFCIHQNEKEVNLNFPGVGLDLSPGCWGLVQLICGD